MASSSDSQRTIAQKTWELSNNILEIAPGEEIYKYDRQQQQQMLAAKPWEKDHHFFKDIKVHNQGQNNCMPCKNKKAISTHIT